MAGTDEVCEFLSKRGVHDSVLAKVREEKMDKRAISLASDEDLRELGVIAQGDILSLRAFATGQLSNRARAEYCSEEGQEESRQQRKKMLIEKLVLGRKRVSRRESASNTKEKKAKAMEAKVKTRKVKLAWQHYNEETKRYVMVRESTGGGQREMSMSTTADVPQILSILIDLFFPNGVSSRGQSSDMDFYLANFQCEVICDDDFSLGNYINVNKLSKPRLYLLSKPKRNPTELKNCGDKDDLKLHQSASTPKQKGQSVQNCSDKDGDEALLCQPVFASTPEQECHDEHVQDDSDHEVMFKGVEGLDDGSWLLDDTVVDPLNTELNDIHHASTSAIHGLTEQTAILKIQCGICLHEIREVAAAHPVGCLDMFHEECLREWQKTTGNGPIKCPICGKYFEDIVTAELVRGTSSEPDQIDDDSHVHVEAQTRTRTRTSPGYRFRQQYLPQFDTRSEEEETQDTALDTCHIDINDGGHEHIATENIDSGSATICYVHRTRLKDDVICFFKNQDSAEHLSSFRVIDERGRLEEGEGAGVTRDVLTTFWQQIFAATSIGDKEKVPCIRHDFQKSEWKAIARVLVFGFKKVDYFPLGLSKAFLGSCLFGEESIEVEYLLSSFRFYISGEEREAFDRVIRGTFENDDEEILDFLGNYKTFKMPTKENVHSILAELAHQELIQRPRYIAQCWTSELSQLKDHVEFSNCDSLAKFYQENMPTAKKVTKIIESRPTNEAETQCLDFLRKFIRSLDAPALGTFLKFTTGSDILPQRLEVSFTSMDGLARRPIAHTCGPLLELPKTYRSYSELAEELTSLLREQGAWGFNIV